jgi:hypothetical protein
MSGDPPWPSVRSLRSIQIIRNINKSQSISHVCGGISFPTILHNRNVDLTRKPFFFCSSSVCIRDAKEAFSVRPRFPGHFNYMVLDVEDNEEQNLIRLFPA